MGQTNDEEQMEISIKGGSCGDDSFSDDISGNVSKKLFLLAYQNVSTAKLRISALFVHPTQ